MSDNRFVLGIGTGRPTSDPKLTIKFMLDRLHLTGKSFDKFAEAVSGLRMPETFIATLRKGIAKAVTGHSDGILLNFCPPEHARNLIRSLGASAGKRPIVSCYLKIFYSRDEYTAKRMLVEEFASYNQNPNYHKMFESAGVAQEIANASATATGNPRFRLGEKLLRISLANPTEHELEMYVRSFREAGVDLPCLYPYFESKEDEGFKMRRVEEIVQV